MADIRLSIAVDSTGAIQSVKQVNDALDQMPKSAGAAGMSLDKFKAPAMAAGAALAAFGAAVVGTGAFVAMQAGKLAKYSDEIVSLSNKFRISTESVQLFKLAAATGGTTIEALAVSMQKMQVGIGKGDDVFARLGLSLNTLKGMNADAAMESVARRIAMIKSPAEQAAAAIEAFGKQGLSVLPALTQGFGELKEKAQEYGRILKGEVVSASEAFGDRLDLVSEAWDKFLMRIGAVIANSPAVMAAIDSLGKIFGQMSAWVEANSEALAGWVKSGLSLAIDGVIGLAEALKLATMGIIGFLKFSSIMFNVTGGGMFSKLMGFAPGKALADFNAGEAMNAMISPIEAFQKAMVEMANAVDASGKKIADSPLFDGSLSFMGAPAGGKGGGGKKGFDLSQSSFLRDLQEYARINSSMAMGMPGVATSFGSAGIPALVGGSKTYDIWGDKSKFLKSEAVEISAVTKPAMSASQALQNLANIAQLSGSKLGKALGGIFGGAAGMASGLGALGKGAGVLGSLSPMLGKLGQWGQVAQGALSIGSAIFGLFKKKPKEPPPEPPKQATAQAWASFTGDQQSKAAAGILAGVSGIRVSTPEDMQAQASIAVSTYWQVFKDKGPMAAAEAFRPVRDKMIETFKAAGADDSAIAALLGPMSGQIDLAANEAFAGAANGMRGFADALAAMANQQLPMTIDQFRAFESQAVNGYEQMKAAAIDQGLSMEDAIKNAALASGTYLTTLKDAAAKYGFDLGGSQALFDEAQKAGVAFGGSSQERLIMSIDRLTETLGGAPPKFQQALYGGAGGFRSQEDTRMDPAAIGDAIAARLRGGFDQMSDAISEGFSKAPPIRVESFLNLDGRQIAESVAGEIESGGPAGTRFREALDGRG